MIKFFVYTTATAKEDEYELVQAEDVTNFAKYEFDPKVMTFSGIAIEADDFQKAVQIYHNPACGFGEYLLSDEPSETAMRREINKATDDVTRHLEYLRCVLLMKLAVSRLTEASTLFNQISDKMSHYYGDDPTMSAPKIFEALMKNTLPEVMKYDGKSKKS